MVTAERFGTGMTFDEYVAYAGSAANLERETTGGAARHMQPLYTYTEYPALYERLRVGRLA